MKRIQLLLCISFVLAACSTKKETIDFVTLSKDEISQFPYKLPGNLTIDSLQEAHNRCMGVSFNPNASLFIRNPLFIGSIVNKKSGELVAAPNNFGINIEKLLSQFSIVTTPCYKKNEFHVPMKSILGDSFDVQLSGTNKEMSKEITGLILESDDAEIEIGSWMYMDMREALKKILDTAKSPRAIQYKKQLLDTANITLLAAENIMKIDFFVTTQKEMTEPIQNLLKSKPSAVMLPGASIFTPVVKLYYISSNQFQVSVDGFFPMVGQFVKVVLK